jgi:hypothetical protein
VRRAGLCAHELEDACRVFIARGADDAEIVPGVVEDQVPAALLAFCASLIGASCGTESAMRTTALGPGRSPWAICRERVRVKLQFGRDANASGMDSSNSD